MKSTDAAYTLVYDGKEDPATKRVYLTTLNNLPLSAGTYLFEVVALNWVDESPRSPTFTVVLAKKVSLANSVVGGNGVSVIAANVDAFVTVQAFDENDVARTAGGDIFYVHVMD